MTSPAQAAAGARSSGKPSRLHGPLLVTASMCLMQRAVVLLPAGMLACTGLAGVLRASHCSSTPVCGSKLHTAQGTTSIGSASRGSSTTSRSRCTTASAPPHHKPQIKHPLRCPLAWSILLQTGSRSCMHAPSLTPASARMHHPVQPPPFYATASPHTLHPACTTFCPHPFHPPFPPTHPPHPSHPQPCQADGGGGPPGHYCGDRLPGQRGTPGCHLPAPPAGGRAELNGVGQCSGCGRQVWPASCRAWRASQHDWLTCSSLACFTTTVVLQQFLGLRTNTSAAPVPYTVKPAACPVAYTSIPPPPLPLHAGASGSGAAVRPPAGDGGVRHDALQWAPPAHRCVKPLL
jgi:hypothetical protein